MPRNIQPPIQPTGKVKQFKNVFLIDSSNTPGVHHDLIFTNGTIHYFEFMLTQSFQYVLVDNRGPGVIRVTYNHPSLVMTSPVNGSKTLSANESLYFEEDIWSMSIYYETASLVEIIGKTNTQGEN